MNDFKLCQCGKLLLFQVSSHLIEVMEENTPDDLGVARAALIKQKALIVTLAKAKRFDAMPVEHMRLRQLERVVQSLVNVKR